MESPVRQVLLFSVCSILLAGCSDPNLKPDHTSQSAVSSESSDRILIQLPDDPGPDTVELKRDMVFESNDDVYINGYIGEIAVDDRNRVYLSATLPGEIGIYVFNPDGSFATRLMREGRGPGELESISRMKIKDDRLYVLGSRLQKYVVYSLDDFSMIYDAVIKRDSIRDRTFSLLRATDLYISDSSNVLLKFRNHSVLDTLKKDYFYNVDKAGQVQRQLILSQERPGFYPIELGSPGKPLNLPLSLPFHRHSILKMSDSGNLYTAWTGEFEINVHSPGGEYLHTYYYPYKKSRLNVDSLGLNDTKRATIEGKIVPGFWPALHTFKIDEKERLWVATITESDSTFDWWVISHEGEVLAKFSFEGERAKRHPSIPETSLFRNGYYYKLERNIRAGIDRIVRYRIEFLSRN